MKSRIVYRRSIFPADIETVFRLLKSLDTLQYIARPYASFKPVDGVDGIVWNEGRTFRFRFRLFCLIPFGTHTIHVIRFAKSGIYTEESNTHVPVWNHKIELQPTADGRTAYSDEVEISAGWKTCFVLIWARLFYRHRQKKWVKMLRG